MSILRNLSVLKNTSVEDSKKETLYDQRLTYHNQGHGTSKACQGNFHNLKTSLEALFHTFEKDCRECEKEQQLLKQPYVTEQKGINTALLNKSEVLGGLVEHQSTLEKQIEKLKQDKINVRKSPIDYGIVVNAKSSLKFWIGLFLLLPLSAYIFIFYISTSYSGFFRNFDPSVDLFGGIFYPQALTEAYNESMLEIGFIVFIPFVFFGLGYLIHMFQQKKGILSILKIAMLFVITFIFDAILAYLIEGKLYDLDKVYGDPNFSVSYALTSPGFWVIIFAGFVSYLIWGLVFDFIMEEHADRDKIQVFISGLNAEINNKKKLLKAQVSKIDSLKEDIEKLKIRSAELDNIIDGFIFPIKNYKNNSSQYLQGWQHFITSELSMSKIHQDELLQKCREEYDLHVDDLGLNNFNSQNKIYLKSS
jgi:hypothetical protein